MRRSSSAGSRGAPLRLIRLVRAISIRRDRKMPALALGSAAREALRLADTLEAMLQGVRETLENGDRKKVEETRRLDDVLDRLNTAIKAYLTSLDPHEFGDADHRRLNQILTFATNLEHAGDAVDRSLLPLAAKRLKRGLVLLARRTEGALGRCSPGSSPMCGARRSSS